MGCGRPVADGGRSIVTTQSRPCSTMPTPVSRPSTWLITMDLQKTCMAFSSIEFVVNALQSSLKRSRVIILLSTSQASTTVKKLKKLHPQHSFLTKWVPPPVKMTSNYVKNNIDISRKRMDVAALDMLQFHWWDYSNSGYLDALKHLTDLKEQGKIKTLALTNFDTERLQIILENGIPIVSNQVQHSIVDMRPQQKMAELCQLTGVQLITYGTVMGGLLSEKFLDVNISIPFAGPPMNTPSLLKYKRMVDAWGNWSLFQALLRTLKKVASKHGVTIPVVAVRYILNQPSVAGSMVGVRLGLSEHIKDTISTFSLVLDKEDMDSITEVSKKGRDLLKVIGDCGDEYRRG
ncbi:hypothetical protein HPP92_002895 [Vanilla planifolia]|uniref:NADP-dependent oxidoreductase domain-containing protein n=1 Tax=Vanilla planifolia TaxID=51239 RepID=A0A835VMX6_VANPL|nr:hypothetical protein HPP92_002895 [Vanilla planifolia]